jgi:hypothetical protein
VANANVVEPLSMLAIDLQYVLDKVTTDWPVMPVRFIPVWMAVVSVIVALANLSRVSIPTPKSIPVNRSRSTIGTRFFNSTWFSEVLLQKEKNKKRKLTSFRHR